MKEKCFLGAQAVLFVDGDFRGDFSSCLQDLLCAVVHKDCDLALTNCYPYIGYRSETAKAVLYYREQLNRIADNGIGDFLIMDIAALG